MVFGFSVVPFDPIDRWLESGISEYGARDSEVNLVRFNSWQV